MTRSPGAGGESSLKPEAGFGETGCAVAGGVGGTESSGSENALDISSAVGAFSVSIEPKVFSLPELTGFV